MNGNANSVYKLLINVNAGLHKVQIVKDDKTMYTFKVQLRMLSSAG